MTGAPAIYDRIGVDYSNLRKPDPRIAAHIHAALGDALGAFAISTVPIPADCSDGFLAAYWRQPETYLDPRVRSGISSFWKIANVELATARLASDLESGEWHRRYGHLLELNEIDAGYRLVTTK